MESLFAYDDYRSYLNDKIESAPKKGYGVAGRLAAHLEVHPSLVSQILGGQKQLTADQAFAAAEFFGLSDLESEYFLLLAQIDRAATRKLKAFLGAKLEKLRQTSKQLSARLDAKQVLSDSAKGIFYSNWTYSAIRQLTAIDRFEGADEIAAAVDLPLKEVHRVLEFLVKHGLCLEKNGRYSIGPQSTHIGTASPWVKVHHRNWRQRSLQALEHGDDDDLFYSSPLTIGAADVARVRELIVKFLEQANKVIDPSPSEELCCLNIDWFKVLRA